jgi:hypothetical protein
MMMQEAVVGKCGALSTDTKYVDRDCGVFVRFRLFFELQKV